MNDEDKAELAEAIAEQLLDMASFETRADRELAARLVTDRVEHVLYHQGWMPPATYQRVSDWTLMTSRIPDHQFTRDVLTSHLSELAGILHDR